MVSTFTLLAALMVATLLMLVFAIWRRLMRATQPPAFLDNDLVAIGSSIFMTLALMASLAFEGFSVMPFELCAKVGDGVNR